MFKKNVIWTYFEVTRDDWDDGNEQAVVEEACDKKAVICIYEPRIIVIAKL